MVLTSPAPGAVMQISRELPFYLQKVEVAAGLSSTANLMRVVMRVDGRTIASFDSPPYRTAWQIVPGRHLFRVEALDTAGAVVAFDEAAVTVEEGP